MTDNPHLRATPVMVGPVDLSTASLVVLAVHGRRQTAQYMVDAARRVDVDAVAYVAPQASDSSWYPQPFLEPVDTNEPALSHALSAVRNHLDSIVAQDIPPERIVVWGFSQGACLLAEYLLRFQPRLAAAVLNTGGYLGPDVKVWPLTGDLSGMPILLTGAARDAWVPLHRTNATAEAFTDLGAAITLYVDSDPEHHINDDVIALMRRTFGDLIPNLR